MTTESALRFLDQRDKNCGQLIGFIFQRCQLLWWSDSGVLEQFEPVECLLQLHQSSVDLRGVFGRRTTSNRFAIVRTNRRPAAKPLVSENPSHTTRRQRVVEPDNAQRVASRPILQILHKPSRRNETRNQKSETRKKTRLLLLVSGF